MFPTMTCICLRFYNIIKYWLKLCHSLDVKYTKQVYNQLLRCIEVRPNKLTWATQVRDLLARYGFYHVWLQHSVGNPKLFLQAVKQRIHDVDVQVLFLSLSSVYT